MLLYLVEASDSEIYPTLTDKGGDICGGEEDESNRQVLDECDIQPVLALELNVGALEEVETGGKEASLCLIRALVS
jgi:hypothetical protein